MPLQFSAALGVHQDMTQVTAASVIQHALVQVTASQDDTAGG